jgi:hypothetical protein
MNYKTFKFISFPLLLFALAELIFCTPQACQEEPKSLVNATFFKNGTDSIKAPDSLTVYGVGKDTNKIYDKSRALKTIQIPLDASKGTSAFVFITNGIIDTLTLTYTSYPHLVSRECGYIYFHTLDSYTVTGVAVDTIIFMKRSITTSNEENIRIFY